MVKQTIQGIPGLTYGPYLFQDPNGKNSNSQPRLQIWDFMGYM
jgi:hypothetical protein